MIKKNRELVAIAFMLLAVSLLLVPVSANYESKTSLINKFKALCDAHPGYASYVSVGKSFLGKDIWLFKIGNPNGIKILWDGQMHGCEDLGSEIEYLMAKWILESTDSRAKRIRSRNCVLFIPVVNVDSYGRKNANTYGGRSDGVNLNRNFVYRWGQSGSSNPFSGDYRGPYAGSEKETQVMRYVFRTYKPRFYVNTHMWGGPWLAYWSPCNMTLVSAVISKIKSISREWNVSPYPTHSISVGGFAIADAQYYGACAWLLELTGSRTPSSSEISSYYYPKCMPILIAMCES